MGNTELSVGQTMTDWFEFVRQRWWWAETGRVSSPTHHRFTSLQYTAKWLLAISSEVQRGLTENLLPLWMLREESRSAVPKVRGDNGLIMMHMS